MLKRAGKNHWAVADQTQECAVRTELVSQEGPEGLEVTTLIAMPYHRTSGGEDVTHQTGLCKMPAEFLKIVSSVARAEIGEPKPDLTLQSIWRRWCAAPILFVRIPVPRRLRLFHEARG